MKKNGSCYECHCFLSLSLCVLKCHLIISYKCLHNCKLVNIVTPILDGDLSNELLNICISGALNKLGIYLDLVFI